MFVLLSFGPGLLQTLYWQRIALSEFDIERQISGGLTCHNRSELRQLLFHLWHQPLNPQRRPAWHIHHVRLVGQRRIALIIRIHQSLCDGVNLTKILICHLADQAPFCHTPTSQHSLNTPTSDRTTTLPPDSSTTVLSNSNDLSSSLLHLPGSTNNNNLYNSNGSTSNNQISWPTLALSNTGLLKPRFGGVNFAVNICRAVIVGPLTFCLWMFWAFSRRQGNFLRPDQSYERLARWASHASIQTLNRAVLQTGTATGSTSTNVGTTDTKVYSSSGHGERGWLSVPSIRRHNRSARHQSGRSRNASNATGHHVTSSGSIRNKNRSIHSVTSSIRSVDSNSSQNQTIGPSSCSSNHRHHFLQQPISRSNRTSSITSTSNGSGSKSGKSVKSSRTGKLRRNGKVSKWVKHAPQKPERSLYWASVDLSQVVRIKQVTRSCLNDVILAAITGAVRQYLVQYAGISRPPDLGCTLPVDIGNVSDMDLEQIGVNYVLLNTPLPTATEGKLTLHLSLKTVLFFFICWMLII